jgi:ribonuclease-3
MDFTERHPVEDQLKLTFHDRGLLQRVFIHRSYLNELPPGSTDLLDNERLEFLGDVVLSFVVSEHLYQLFPEKQEGDLTNLRAALVRRETLAKLAQQLSLGDFLLLGHGEEESGGRTRAATLCAVFEALVGAIYLDQGIPALRTVILSIMEKQIDRMRDSVHQKDPKSRLQEWVQSTMGYTPRYKLVQSIGPDHAKFFVMLVNVNSIPRGVGSGRSKQDATQRAAAMALYRFGQPAEEYQPDAGLEAQYNLTLPSA